MDQDKEALYRFFERKLQEADKVNEREINQFGYVLIGTALAALFLLAVWAVSANYGPFFNN